MKHQQPRYDREKHRVAHRLRESLREGAEADRQRVQQHLQMLRPQLEKLQQQAWRLELAHRHGFHGARRRILCGMPAQQSNLHYEIELLGQLLRRPGRQVPTLRELVAELDYLEQEFGDWDYRPQSRTLGVETEPIVLEGLELGPFAIELPIAALSRNDPQTALEAIARAPNPAAGSPSVTHPHVSDERICLGEASQPVRRALGEGRLTDAFLLVRSLLHHYNPESPYVAIEEWHAEPCEDCGGAMDEESRRFCDVCERNYCPECMSRCEGCDSPACLGCLSHCDHCGEPFCRDCQREGLCQTCFEDMENDDDEQHELTEEDEPGHAIQEAPEGQIATTQRPDPYRFDRAVRGDGSPRSGASVHTSRVGEAALPVPSR